MPLCICLSNIVVIRRSSAELWCHIHFSRWPPAAILDMIWVMLDTREVQLPVSAWSSNLVLIRFIVLKILRFLNFSVLVWNFLFTPVMESFGGIFSPNMVTHRSNCQKDHPCVETRRLSHKAWKSVQRFDQCVGSRKKVRTGRDSQKKSQGGIISPFWGEAPTVPIETKICTAGNLADVITCAKFQDDIFTGYN